MKYALTTIAIAALAPINFAQLEVQKLVPADGESLDIFGAHVAVSGDFAFVGQPGLGTAAEPTVYAYRREPGGWVQTQSLVVLDDGFSGSFGDDIAMYGNTAVVTDPARDHGAALQAGVLYVYERNSAGWARVQRLFASEPEYGAGLGRSVALDGDVMVVGSIGKDYLGIDHAGAAYVFERIAGSWVETAQLYSSDPASEDAFGIDVAVCGDTIVVGDLGDDGRRGAAYVFERAPSGWQLSAKLVASDGVALDSFGWAVAVDGDRVVVCAPWNDTGAQGLGAAYLFERSASGWSGVDRFIVPDSRPGEVFGYNLAMAGDTVLLPATELGDSYGPGSLHVLRLAPGSWRHVGTHQASDAQDGQAFGLSVAIDGGTAFVGSIWDEVNGAFSGSAYVFDIPEHAVPYGLCTSGAPCGNETLYRGCANETGTGAWLRARGTTSVSNDDLRMITDGLPVGVPAILFHGTGAQRRTFGDGLMLVNLSGGSRRYSTHGTDIDGRAYWGPGLFGSTGILAGQTLWFQVWYQSPGGPCSSGSNLSNGLRVTFEP